jgi:4-amino-4-deoxy-L-arabinose transferase-like glycosyltransferase
MQFKRIGLWLAAHPRWTLTLLVGVALGPLLAKPFNIDDPLFVWLARQVRAHPAAPFDFQVNWYGLVLPMWAFTGNPPGAGYYFALAGGLFGRGEIGLHLGGLLAALAVILGTHRLAARWCAHPLLAAGAVLCMPVFLVSASTVMCDVLMLAFWVWAVVFWVEGLEQDRASKIFAAGLLIALAFLTKYFGVALVPLLAVYGGLYKRKFGGWVFALAIPLAALGGYEWLTHLRYGHALFSAAADLSAQAHANFGVSKPASFLIALSFTGGGVAATLFLAPWLWRGRALAAVLVVTALVGGVLCFGDVLHKYPSLHGSARLSVAAQFMLWMWGGVLVLWLAADVLRHPREPQAWLLALWLTGTFLFTAFGNWTINGRTVLPLAPAVGILLARRWERPGPRPAWALPASLAVCAVLALLVVESDFQLAVAARRNAQEVMAKLGRGRGTVWFQGHWGFQYYMEQLGAKAADLEHFTPSPGDILVVPLHNTCTSEPPPDRFARRDVMGVPGPAGLTTFHAAVGAGFYSSYYGPLPFAFGQVPAEALYVYDVKPVAPK